MGVPSGLVLADPSDPLCSSSTTVQVLSDRSGSGCNDGACVSEGGAVVAVTGAVTTTAAEVAVHPTDVAACDAVFMVVHRRRMRRNR